MSVAAGVEFDAVAQGFYLETLLVDGDDIWFSDFIVGGVRNVGSDQVLLPERTMIGGLLLNDDGSLLVSGRGRYRMEAPGQWPVRPLAEGRTLEERNSVILRMRSVPGAPLKRADFAL